MINSFPKSAKELNKLLIQLSLESIDLYEGKQHLGGEIRHLALEDADAPPLAKILASFDSSGGAILSCLRYWDLREKIQKFQQENNISSIYFKETKWKGEIFRFPTTCDQLAVMPQDLAIVSRFKMRVASCFMNFLKRHNIPLHQEKYDEEGEWNEIVTEEIFWDAVKSAQWAWLGCGQVDQPVYDSESRAVAYYFSSYSIYLCDGIGVDFNSTRFEGYTSLTIAD